MLFDAQGNSNLSQSLMRTRVVFQARHGSARLRVCALTRLRCVQGVTVAVMVGTSSIVATQK